MRIWTEDELDNPHLYVQWRVAYLPRIIDHQPPFFDGFERTAYGIEALEMCNQMGYASILDYLKDFPIDWLSVPSQDS